VKYFTMNKRIVYGGGGIMPDVFVPIDTSQSSAHFGQLVRKGVLNTFALAYVDANRNRLITAYKDPDAFRTAFMVDDALLAELEVYGEKEGVEQDPEGLQRSRDLISIRLKGLIARDLWDTSAYWQVINADNPVDRSFQQALKSLSDDSFHRFGMVKP
jgi:carboxyl-terminal processing protease